MSAPFSYRAGICRCGLVPGPGFPVARWGQRAAPGRVVQVSGPGLHQVVVDCRVRRGLLAAAAGFVPKDAAGRCAATVRALLWRCCCRSRCLGRVHTGQRQAYAASSAPAPVGSYRQGARQPGTTPGLGVRRPGSPPGCGRAAGHRLVRFHAGLAGRGCGCCVTGCAGPAGEVAGRWGRDGTWPQAVARRPPRSGRLS